MSVTPTLIEVVAAALFAIAIVHTFATKSFERLAHRRPRHAGLFHLLAEVEIVFGFWALVLVIVMALAGGTREAISYVEARNFTEPLFVFAIMVIAGTRPILQTTLRAVEWLGAALPLAGACGFYLVAMTVVPLLGSFITEPAAMTLAALMLSQKILSRQIPERMKYATLGVLFVNVSIGGTLTHFAAPPVLMVAETWGWDTPFMFSTFGAKAAAAVAVNAIGATFAFRRELAALAIEPAREAAPVPPGLVVVHFLFLVAVVATAHHPAVFIGLLLFFLGIANAYERHQDRIILREGLLVGFFLAGLVVLGGMQEWWLRPVLLSMNSDAVFFGAAALTAFTDNAALTYLGSLVPGLSDGFKYALVAGAVAGGGLTVIANAPNPAGIAILQDRFEEGAVNPLHLLLAAIPPTIVALLAFRLF